MLFLPTLSGTAFCYFLEKFYLILWSFFVMGTTDRRKPQKIFLPFSLVQIHNFLQNHDQRRFVFPWQQIATNFLLDPKTHLLVPYLYYRICTSPCFCTTNSYNLRILDLPPFTTSPLISKSDAFLYHSTYILYWKCLLICLRGLQPGSGPGFVGPETNTT